ncbi:DUF4234 domain-containing protein [Dehalococcoides mccartyi]|nr:DUF4234 domain-containing protein [Dehalococcoides mccartyi]
MVKRRSMVFQVIVYILTFGLYSFYWYYSTLDEMTKLNGQRTEALLWTVLMFIPLANLFAMWKHAAAADLAFEKTYPTMLLWVLWIFVTPAVWILLQIELNRIAGTPFPDPRSAE